MALGHMFMFCVPKLIFGDTEGVISRFQVLLFRNRFRYRGRRILFSCFALPDSVSAVPRAPTPVFKFFAPRLVFGGIDGVGPHFHVLRSHTRFSTVLRASGPFFMFSAPRLIIGGTKGFGYHFHVLRSRTHFRRDRERRVPFSCFVLLDSFSAIPRASGAVFKFCARTHFRRYYGRLVPFSSFARTV
jgi:hypothetical protein